jgi:hypothetical protein
MCEWEAQHDVAARGRQVDPAAALHRYLSHAHIEEDCATAANPRTDRSLWPLRVHGALTSSRSGTR